MRLFSMVETGRHHSVARLPRRSSQGWPGADVRWRCITEKRSCSRHALQPWRRRCTAAYAVLPQTSTIATRPN